MVWLAVVYCAAVVGIGILAGRLADWQSERRRQRGAARPPSAPASSELPAAIAQTATAPPTTEPETEPTIAIPVSIVEQLYASLSRLEVLERRESMRLVEREQRKARPRTRF